MADILELKRMLLAQAEAVAEHLLPAGKREGHEWRAGSIAGEPGRSLAVHLDGRKAGVWADFNGGEGGDLIDLWAAVKHLDLPAALDEIRAWLGLPRPSHCSRPSRALCSTLTPARYDLWGALLRRLRDNVRICSR